MYTYKATVDRVVDGDTVDLWIDLGFSIITHQRIRLARIDAPERFTDDGKLATSWLVDELQGKEIRVATEKTGKYGRWIGEVEIFDGLYPEWDNVSDLMVKAGFAKYRSY